MRIRDVKVTRPLTLALNQRPENKHVAVSLIILKIALQFYLKSVYDSGLS